MNPKNKWNPSGVVPFSETLVYPAHRRYISESPGQSGAPRNPFPTTEMHYPRYRYDLQFYNRNRDVVPESEIYREQSNFQWSGQGKWGNQRQGAARAYRRVEPTETEKTLAYHRSMYPPSYAEMWDYHPQMNDTWNPDGH